MKKLSASSILLFLILVAWVWTATNIHRWTKQVVIDHDIVHYYSYLPATFIYKDLSFQFINDLPEDFEGRIWYKLTEDGKPVQKMTMGMAYLYAPFFGLGHFHATVSDAYRADGYSMPYAMYLTFSSIFYAFLGLILLRRILLLFYNDKIATWVIAIVALGTNFFYYVTNEGVMSHAYSFFLFALFFYAFTRYHQLPRFYWAIIMGVSFGLISLVRPSNAIIILLPVLYGITSWRDLREKFYQYSRNYSHLLMFALLVFLIWLPQLLYWKTITGQWLYNSYGEEGFVFSDPQIWKGLFSYRKGWLLYTPLMALAVAGIPVIYKKQREHFWGISVYFIVNIYIVFSWWCWWYGGSYGARPLIESYAILALPLGAFIFWLYQQKKWVKRLSFSLIAVLILLSLFQTWQYRRNIIHFDSMTREAYWEAFGKIKKPKERDKTLDHPDYETFLHQRMGSDKPE